MIHLITMRVIYSVSKGGTNSPPT